MGKLAKPGWGMMAVGLRDYGIFLNFGENQGFLAFSPLKVCATMAKLAQPCWGTMAAGLRDYGFLRNIGANQAFLTFPV